MNGNKKVILHLIFDGILFDRTYSHFEEMENYENRYLFGGFITDEKIKYIKNTEKLIRVESLEEWGKIVSDSQVDIIYMHGLWPDYIKAIDYVRDNVIIMWWCYGMEIYENCYGLPPLMGLNIYKPKTYEFVESFGGFRYKIKLCLLLRHPKIYMLWRKISDTIHRRPERKLIKMLSRIDYAFTPLEKELVELKKKCPYIKAKPFKLRAMIERLPIEIHEKSGNLLLEHSANISNNHLDLLASLKEKKLNLQGRDIYVPLGYGNEKLAALVHDEAHFDGAVVKCLMDAMPFEEYKKMMSGCTHAIFGMLRQSGLGNIFLCFQKGIKIFFFKDSILYKQFISDGFHVYSIEDDLNEKSIREPLEKDKALRNYELYYTKFVSTDSFQQQFSNILNS